MQSLQPFIDPARIAEQRLFRLVPADRVTCRAHAVAKILGDLHRGQDEATGEGAPWGEDPAAGARLVRRPGDPDQSGRDSGLLSSTLGANQTPTVRAFLAAARTVNFPISP